jgi:hypothetical protein
MLPRRVGPPAFFMTYRFTHGTERWKINASKVDAVRGWQLYRAVDEAWERLAVFATPSAAMAAVGAGNTGVASWDARPHDQGDFTDNKWSREGW